PVASMATVFTPLALKYSHSSPICWLTVRNTLGSLPPIEAKNFSLPTSTAAACGLTIGSSNGLFIAFWFCPRAMRARRALCSLNKTNLPNGISSHENACFHQLMPLQRDEAILLNGLLTPGFFATMPHA